jgi:SAM-dependent methyltransferase
VHTVKEILFDSRPSTDEIWDALQTCNVDFVLPLELTGYFQSSGWQEARAVLDVGCGNGYYLSRIARLFPDKQYHGVDRSEAMIGLARTRLETDRLRFDLADAFRLDGSYDFVILRLLLQHIDRVDELLRSIADVLSPGGGVFILDADDSERFYHPTVPRFMEFFAAYVEQQRGSGLDRDASLRLAEIGVGAGRFDVVRRRRWIVPSTIPGNLAILRRTYAWFIRLVETTGRLSYDYDALKQEWLSWCERDDTYTQIGVSFVELRRQ